MMLRTRAVVTSALLALPAAALLTTGVEMVRLEDQRVALERVVRSQINDQVRERCESDPNWFLTGPQPGRPKKGEPVNPDPDALPPRPKVTDQPFELFGYDQEFAGSSSAAPRFPNDYRRILRTVAAPDAATGPFVTSAGRGVEIAIATGWTASPCMYLYGRLRPVPNQLMQRVKIFAAAFVTCMLVGWLAVTPMVVRARRLSHAQHTSVAQNYTAIAPEKLRDELSSLTFVYNDTATELHDRKTRIDDQDEAMRRLVSGTQEEVGRPLSEAVRQLGDIPALVPDGPGRERARAVFQAVQQASARLENLAAAARVRAAAEVGREPIDLRAMTARVVEHLQPAARAASVSLTTSVTKTPITIEADAILIERAIANLVDNAIRYNRPGGRVTVSLEPGTPEGQFSLRVTDNGPGVTEEEFKGLTAIRRFRGDESRNRRPGAPGLGISVTRAIADRSGLRLELNRPATGGFEAELSKRL